MEDIIYELKYSGLWDKVFELEGLSDGSTRYYFIDNDYKHTIKVSTKTPLPTMMKAEDLINIESFKALTHSVFEMKNNVWKYMDSRSMIGSEYEGFKEFL